VLALTKQAFDLDPQYLFARCGWASCLARQGRPDEAEALITDYFGQMSMHHSEYGCWVNAQLDIASARGDTSRVEELRQSLRQLEATFA
jgi:hypothetical protein